MNDKPIQVLVVEPLKPCEVREICGLKAMQELVGGAIQAVYPFRDEVALICNRDAKNLGLPYNRPLTNDAGIPYDIICGTFFLAGLDGEHFVSLTEEQVRRFKDIYDRTLITTVEQPGQQREHTPDTALSDFSISCRILFSFTGSAPTSPAEKEVFVRYIGEVFKNDKTLIGKTVGKLAFLFQGQYAELRYIFSRRDTDMLGAEFFSEQCVRKVQEQMEKYGCKVERVACLAKEQREDLSWVKAQLKGHKSQEERRRRKSTFHEK